MVIQRPRDGVQSYRPIRLQICSGRTCALLSNSVSPPRGLIPKDHIEAADSSQETVSPVDVLRCYVTRYVLIFSHIELSAVHFSWSRGKLVEFDFKLKVTSE